MKKTYFLGRSFLLHNKHSRKHHITNNKHEVAENKVGMRRKKHNENAKPIRAGGYAITTDPKIGHRRQKEKEKRKATPQRLAIPVLTLNTGLARHTYTVIRKSSYKGERAKSKNNKAKKTRTAKLFVCPHNVHILLCARS
jgi:hypothetical protein